MIQISLHREPSSLKAQERDTGRSIQRALRDMQKSLIYEEDMWFVHSGGCAVTDVIRAKAFQQGIYYKQEKGSGSLIFRRLDAEEGLVSGTALIAPGVIEWDRSELARERVKAFCASLNEEGISTMVMGSTGKSRRFVKIAFQMQFRDGGVTFRGNPELTEMLDRVRREKPWAPAV